MDHAIIFRRVCRSFLLYMASFHYTLHEHCSIDLWATYKPSTIHH